MILCFEEKLFSVPVDGVMRTRKLNKEKKKRKKRKRKKEKRRFDCCIVLKNMSAIDKAEIAVGY